jgi:hypothetical protein
MDCREAMSKKLLVVILTGSIVDFGNWTNEMLVSTTNNYLQGWRWGTPQAQTMNRNGFAGCNDLQYTYTLKPCIWTCGSSRIDFLHLLAQMQGRSQIQIAIFQMIFSLVQKRRNTKHRMKKVIRALVWQWIIVQQYWGSSGRFQQLFCILFVTGAESLPPYHKRLAVWHPTGLVSMTWC